MNLKSKIGSNKIDKKLQLQLLTDLDIFLQKKYSIYDVVVILNAKYNLEKEFLMLDNGSFVYEILSNKIADKDILLVIEIAEVSGNLADGINKSKKLLEQKINSSNQIFELIKYPLLLLVIMMLAILFIGFFLLPQFKSIYTAFNIEISWVIELIFIIIKVIPLVICLIIVIIIFLILVIKELPSQLKIKYLLTNKYTRAIYLNIYNQVFVMNILNLLDVGLKLDEAMDVLIFQNYNLFLKTQAIKIKRQMLEGKYLYEALNPKYYSQELILLIKEGEKNNNLISNCESYLKYISQGQQNRTKQLLFLIQPIIYLIFAFLIIIVYASIFIPMFKMMSEF